jgi:hypothetical protein
MPRSDFHKEGFFRSFATVFRISRESCSSDTARATPMAPTSAQYVLIASDLAVPLPLPFVPRIGPYRRFHGTLGERNQESADERIQTREQAAAAISCATCSDPNDCDTRICSGKFGAHDNLGGPKRKSLPFYRRNRIYDAADRGSRNCLFEVLRSCFCCARDKRSG